MLDRYNLSAAGWPQRQEVTIEEKRAPTDESVRLLREMEAAAQAKVIAAVRVEDCPIDCVIHAHHDVLNDDILLAAVVRINGKRLVIEHRQHSLSKAAAIEGLMAAISREIAATILGPALRRLDPWAQKLVRGVAHG